MQHVSAFVDTHSPDMADMIAVEILDNNEEQKVSEDLDFIDLYENEPSMGRNVPSNSTTNEGDDIEDDSGSDLPLNSVTANSSTSSTTTSKKRKQMSKDNKSHLLLQKAIDPLNTPEEEDSNDAIFGKYVGTSLSAMPENVNKFILKNKIQNLVCETQILNLNQQYQSSSQ
ncbi:unnamed protein product [Mytilus coruscus]|uniref:BESS domain-containing protein n=1 Tax=Mytilus coruscus TaxID=42192 RepID=A0A6J8CBA3_MYTCO|nr:unnamed protein product [Mytilus coruscus]